jgi:hypothetical protein
LAIADACSNVIDFDTLNVTSRYMTGVRTCDFASISNWARRSAVASGSSAHSTAKISSAERNRRGALPTRA